MVSTGNKAILISSEICQKCAKCCKEFVCGGFDLDCALRFLWIDDKHIKARDSSLRDDFGNIKREVVFKFPCSQLEERNGKYKCKVWDKERPDFCNTYPDHIFFCCDIWDTIKIQKLLDETQKDCSALKNVSVHQVQEMLAKTRGEENARG